MNAQRWKQIKALQPGAPKMLHVSSEPYHLPAAGKDAHVDALVAKGDLIVLSQSVLPNGVVVRYARSKGVTYEKPPANNEPTRKVRRMLRHAFGRWKAAMQAVGA